MVQMWAIDWRNNDYFLTYFVRRTRQQAIDDFIERNGGTWKQYYRQGYRAIKVSVTRTDVKP